VENHWNGSVPGWERTWIRPRDLDPLRTQVKAHDLLEICLGSQNLCATEKESRAYNKQMTAI